MADVFASSVVEKMILLPVVVLLVVVLPVNKSVLATPRYGFTASYKGKKIWNFSHIELFGL